MEFAEVLEQVYSCVPGDFMSVRTEAEKAAKGTGDKALAADIKSLKKPSMGAWAVNQLVRWEADQIAEVFALAAQLRIAANALDGAQLRALTRQRRQLTAALTTRARQLALEQGQRITPAVAEQIEDTLTAAMIDAGVEQAVRTGLLVTTIASTGLESTEPGLLVAHGDAIGHVAPRVEPSKRALHAVPDNTAVRRAAALDALKASQTAFEEADQALRAAEDRAAEVEAALLQRTAELDELQRKLADLEAEIETVSRQRDEASLDVEASRADSARAIEARDQAQRALDRLN